MKRHAAEKPERASYPTLSWVSIFFVVFVSCLITLGIVGCRFVGDTLHAFEVDVQDIYIIITQPSRTIAGCGDPCTILLLGIGGGEHEGPLLTDSMIVLTVSPKTKRIDMISLPRDVWSDFLKDKINSAYYYGVKQYPATPLELAKTTVGELTGIPINGAIVVDFSAFVQIIDAVGGIQIDVSESFVDTQYPIAGKELDLCNGDATYACRYETISFMKGIQQMDGATALKYVRSRHAQGTQGSDFARSRRQQEVVLGITTAIRHVSFSKMPSLRDSMFSIYAQSVVKDVPSDVLFAIARMWFDKPHVSRIDIGDQFVEAPPYKYAGRYVLVPKNGLEEVHEAITASMSGAVL